MQLRYEGAALPTSRQREGAYAVIYIIGLIGLDPLNQLPTYASAVHGGFFWRPIDRRGVPLYYLSLHKRLWSPVPA
jgi:hypothetical protein